MERFFKIAFLLGIAFSFLFFLAPNTRIFAQEGGGGAAPACQPGPMQCSSSKSSLFQCKNRLVYQCFSNACGEDGGAIEQATEYFTCQTTTVSCSDGCSSTSSSSTASIGGPFYKDRSQHSTAGKYQICPASGNVWSAQPPAYQCSAQCYPPPAIKPLNDKSLNPKNVFDAEKKPKLPLNLGWKDNVEQELASNPNPDGSFCSVETYQYEIPNALLPVTETTPVTTHNVIVDEDECKLAPQASYNFQVQACAQRQSQQECGETGKLGFTTSPAPQLLSPYDPDWEGKEPGRTAFPSILEWCPHPNQSIKSYSVKAYTVNNNGTKGNSVLEVPGVPGNQTKYEDSSFRDHLSDLQKGLSYFWEVAPCTDSGARQCGIFSQLWKVVPEGELKAPAHLFPASGSFVNMTDALKWQNIVFATHYVVHIRGGTLDKDFFTQGLLSLESIWQELALTTAYTWKVAPCGGPPTSQDMKDCENENGAIPWSKEQQFTTTGAQPQNLQITPTEKGVAGIPLTLDWDDSGGAASYEIVTSPSLPPRIVTEKSETTLQYPALKTKTPYSFAVKTCTDKLATVCGPEASGSFTTVTLASPPLTAPPIEKKEFDPSTNISWDKVFSSNFYSYTLTFVSPSPQEVSPECKTTHDVASQIIAENEATVRFRCLGNYTISVQACIDERCKEFGEATVSTLSVETLLARTGGLVPCDRGNDNLSTPYDERKECGLGSVFLLIRNLIDFALWKLSLIVVIVMVIVTAAIMFFSFGGTDVMTKVRSIWKSVGIGVLILLFSWLFLNILLDLVGFNINFYGHWFLL